MPSKPPVVKPITDPSKQPKTAQDIQRRVIPREPCSFCMETRKRVKNWLRWNTKGKEGSS